MPFRAKGIPSALQIQDYQDERNPYNHEAEDTIAHMNLDYWLEQVKATVAIAAHLAAPIPVAEPPTPMPTASPTATSTTTPTPMPSAGAGSGIYLPVMIKLVVP